MKMDRAAMRFHAERGGPQCRFRREPRLKLADDGRIPASIEGWTGSTDRHASDQQELDEDENAEK